MTPGLTKSFGTSADCARRLIVKFTADGVVAPASAAADLSIGVTDMSAADVTSGNRADVRLTGIAEIVVGGAINRGAKVTADASGHAVAAAPAGGANAQVIGIAMATYASGDIGDFLLIPSVMQG